MAIVLTLGTFDLAHRGHMHLFKQCRKIAGPDGEVHVAVNSDEFIQEFKGRPPVQTFRERIDVLDAVKYIDYLHRTPGPDSKPLILSIKPDFLVIGSDWAPPKDYYGQLQITPEWMTEHGIALLYLDRWSEDSSTNLKERIRNA